jgi:hypothetical protein
MNSCPEPVLLYSHSGEIVAWPFPPPPLLVGVPSSTLAPFRKRARARPRLLSRSDTIRYLVFSHLATSHLDMEQKRAYDDTHPPSAVLPSVPFPFTWLIAADIWT